MACPVCYVPAGVAAIWTAGAASGGMHNNRGLAASAGILGTAPLTWYGWRRMARSPPTAAAALLSAGVVLGFCSSELMHLNNKNLSEEKREGPSTSFCTKGTDVTPIPPTPAQ
mmetsp:Transcript_12844/g.19454  ORF Transcript_12844/g.19454 Transcript_12844/m.19454 type:complete len:113 (+) Transcript_12844:78-416(+)|eukprot:CAMPEP_0194748484 /NCGR_PEP_ID=MMETSP0323_2-20130528/2602_1 /TAXON_ID=2866 ORGANISM="Crypthecodinium cohnii, Strain Seligo" /NCGR_SAMPLE_ID=MMETSP0323_2 /ASSEMBLY_ACC=CAM_ASM_000346 /LENGTH=112 /DNA_ID=CAMNT_0039662747 /DNA_START=78 /DNA_END=416 /DNA_ORIENTATION=+